MRTGGNTTNQGFTLIELMIVVAIIAVVAAIAIPSLHGARKSANEAKAIASLRTLYTTMEQYRTRFGEYGGLEDLQDAGYIAGFDTDGTGVTKGGYRFIRQFLIGSGQNQWRVRANPLSPGSTGDRWFSIRSVGVIHFSMTGPCTSSSPVLD